MRCGVRTGTSLGPRDSSVQGGGRCPGPGLRLAGAERVKASGLGDSGQGALWGVSRWARSTGQGCIMEGILSVRPCSPHAISGLQSPSAA